MSTVMERQGTEIHVFNENREPPILCHCGKHHYRCFTCKADCTKGEPAGPATESDGRVRCVTCWRRWDSLRHALMPHSAEEASMLCVVLSLLTSTTPWRPLTEAERDLARQMLFRVELRCQE